MRNIIPIIALFVALSGSAQQKAPTQADLEKMAREMEKKAAELQKDPNLRKMMQEHGMSITDAAMENGSPWAHLPVKNTKALAALPKTVLTADSLKKFVQAIDKKLARQSSPSIQSNVAASTQATKNNGALLSHSAIAAWYKNDALTAITLAGKAASISPEDPEVLNTFGALLNLCGHPEKALPILLYLNKVQGENSTVLNNIGQAYLLLGDQANAEKYLLQSIAHCENHVEANKSLGMMYAARGQVQQAKLCIQRSLKGGFTQTAVDAAEQLNMDQETVDEAIMFLLPNIKAPEYFNTYKYELPQQCENVGTAAKTHELVNKYQAYLTSLIEKYSQLEEAETVKIKQEAEVLMKSVQQGMIVRASPSPLFEKAKRKYSKILEGLGHFSTDVMMPALIKFSKERDKLDERYEARYIAINISDSKNKCAEFDQLANEFLPLYAANSRDLTDKYLTIFQGYIDDLIYWGQFLNVLHDARARTFGTIKGYLQHLVSITRDYKIISPSCGSTAVSETAPPADAETIKPECPFDIGINLVVADITLNCESIGIEVNLGLSLSAEKEFGGETTLAVGIGLGSSKGYEIPVIKVESSVGVSEKLYIVFDSDNHFSDVGLKLDAGAKIGLSGQAGPLSTDIGTADANIGYTLGLNSGWTFSGEAMGTSLKL